jgi:hypothetical protein
LKDVESLVAFVTLAKTLLNSRSAIKERGGAQDNSHLSIEHRGVLVDTNIFHRLPTLFQPRSPLGPEVIHHPFKTWIGDRFKTGGLIVSRRPKTPRIRPLQPDLFFL